MGTTEGKTMTTSETGVQYLMARATSDGRVRELLREIWHLEQDGRYPESEQLRRTLDDMVYQLTGDGRPRYSAVDVTTAVGRIGCRQQSEEVRS
jgi:hypothetical protein